MKPEIRKTIFALAGYLIAVNVMAQWATITVPTKNNLNSIALLNESSGWIVGDKGTILYRYMDSWMSFPGVTNENLNSVCLLSSSDGWVVGAHGTILHLKGKKWIRVESPTLQNLYSVCFSDTDNGYAVGNNGTLLFYKNGIWEMAERSTPGHLYTVVVKDDHAFIAGGRENITVPIMVTDFSDSYRFTKIHDPGYVEITGMALPEADIVWAVGKPGIILHNEGTVWQKVEIDGKLPSLTSVFFSGKDSGITVGYGGTILTYSASGWQKEESPVSVRLNGAVIEGNTFYAVGNSGTVVELKRNPLPSPKEETINPPAIISSYPNPSSGFLNITIPEKVNNYGVITILNSRGQVVLVKEFDKGREGSTDQFSTTGLSNGLYIINIVTGGRIIASGKFIVNH